MPYKTVVFGSSMIPRLPTGALVTNAGILAPRVFHWMYSGATQTQGKSQHGVQPGTQGVMGFIKPGNPLISKNGVGDSEEIAGGGSAEPGVGGDEAMMHAKDELWHQRCVGERAVED